MDFSEEIQLLADRVQKLRPNLLTEEATKNALVLPFIKALGYDIFNPLEVEPEFIADVAGKKGEKVDFAVKHNGEPIMLIECKCCGTNLNEDKHEQLQRYFMTLNARIGILTDGVRYLFFSDLDEANRLDRRPFMEFNLDNIDITLVQELRKLCKGKFDLQTALSAANELKYNRELKLIFKKHLESPSENFVSYCAREVYEGKVTTKIKEQFTQYVKRAFTEFIAECLDERLKSALAATSKKEEVLLEEPSIAIKTTENEWQAFYIIKAICMNVISPERIFIRDSVNLCNILLDDSIRKNIIRLYFNNPDKLSIEFTSDNKEKVKYNIAKVEDIMQYSDIIIEIIKKYDATS